MPMARTKRGRLRQVENWLRDLYPTPRPTHVDLVDLKQGRRDRPDAITTRRGRSIFILIHSKLGLWESILALLEEWAHAMTWGLASSEKIAKHHGPDWGIAYAELKTAYFDDEEKPGWKRSREYPSE